jgi:transcriptional regulator with XRE-family HTH domain
MKASNKIKVQAIESDPDEKTNPFLDEIEIEISNHIARKIKVLRKIHSISQADIAKKMNISFQQFQKYEKGSTKISAARLFVIAKFFGIDVNFFFVETESFRKIEEIVSPNKMVMEDIKFISGYLNENSKK